MIDRYAFVRSMRPRASTLRQHLAECWVDYALSYALYFLAGMVATSILSPLVLGGLR